MYIYIYLDITLWYTILHYITLYCIKLNYITLATMQEIASDEQHGRTRPALHLGHILYRNTLYDILYNSTVTYIIVYYSILNYIIICYSISYCSIV